MAHRKNFASLSADFTVATVVLPSLPRMIVCGLAFLVVGAPSALGQAPVGTKIENFRVSEKSADGKRTTLLTGAQAVFREDGQLALQNPRLVSVTAEGKTNLVFNATECLYDQDTKLISSPGKLLLSTADGQMQLSGTDFSGNLAGPTLKVSSEVKARLNKQIGGVPLGQAATQSTKESGGEDVIQISATEFDLQPGQAEFRDSVTVTDADGTLKSEVIKVSLRQRDWVVQSIGASGGVVLQNERFKTSSDRANYDLASGMILFRGNPRWEMDDRSGRADLLMIDRESTVVSAQGNVSMKLPAESGAESGLFQFSPTRQKEESLQSVALEIQASHFIFQPAGENCTGYARYIGSVRMSRGASRMECQLLNINLSSGDRGEVETAAAIGVKLSQGEDHLSSQLAVYDFANGWIRLEMNPVWNLSGQTGSANRVELLPEDGKFRAADDVKMNLPKQSGGIGFLFPENARKQETETTSPLMVDCDLFEYRRALAANQPDEAAFLGDVHLANDNGFSVKAQSVSLVIDSEKNEIKSIVAVGELNGSTAGENSMRFVGNRLVYDRTADTVRLTGEPRVEIQTQQEGSEVVALGQAAQYAIATGQLKLTGNPILKTPEGELRGNEVLYDQQAKRLRASGRWKMTLNAKLIRQMQESPKKPEPTQR